ncbi:fructose-6-phosphate aldolase [Holosporaceae bacterium 'Namur']|nr:fructose-6-phosphate aldolase [Holosporaceae bacterium 'Namur']
MKFFIDSCNIKEIEALHELGLVDGVTTNPSLVAKTGRIFSEVLREICHIVKTSVSAEVISTDYSGMMKEAEELLKIGNHITIKVPVTWDGLKACKTLTDDGHMVNVTLCFSLAQALLAAKAGATYISPFVGRLDDVGQCGMNLIAEICEAFQHYPNITTQILVASVRSPQHIIDAARMGADIVTAPPQIIKQMFNHPLTDKGLDIFLNDWKRAYEK